MPAIAISRNEKKSIELCAECTAALDAYKNLHGAAKTAKARANDGGASMCIDCEKKLKEIGWKLGKPKAHCTDCGEYGVIEAENDEKTQRLCKPCVLKVDPNFQFQS